MITAIDPIYQYCQSLSKNKIRKWNMADLMKNISKCAQCY
uniref:Bm13396 n=1 Tax=Brugia malayi TaxID=6279 RepID=A0A1I9G6R0_BRUMA|nr:Bm13396 [Brugia malayi]